MELYIGGAAQGKLDYVRSLYPDAEVWEAAEIVAKVNAKNTFENVGVIDNKTFDAPFERGILQSTTRIKNSHESRKSDVIWHDVHLAIRELLASGVEPDAVEAGIISIASSIDNLYFISNELGCGIVPMDAFERFYREFHGRLLVKIAAMSNKVVRITCGLPQVIKDE